MEFNGFFKSLDNWDFWKMDSGFAESFRNKFFTSFLENLFYLEELNCITLLLKTRIPLLNACLTTIYKSRTALLLSSCKKALWTYVKTPWEILQKLKTFKKVKVLWKCFTEIASVKMKVISYKTSFINVNL